MKIPAAVWWVLIPLLTAALTPVIQQYFPQGTVFWADIAVAVLGVAAAFVAAWRAEAKPAPTPAGQVAPEGETMIAPVSEKSFVRRWLVG